MGVKQPHTFLAVICKYPKQYFIFVSYCLCLAESSTQWTKLWFHIKHWYNRTEECRAQSLHFHHNLGIWPFTEEYTVLKPLKKVCLKTCLFLSITITSLLSSFLFWRTMCKIFLFHHSGTLENLFLYSVSQFSSLRAIKLRVTATFGEPRLFTSLINTLGWKTNHFIICSLWEVLSW